MTEWRVTRLGRKGDGVAEAEGRQALAPLTLPGEVIAGEAEDGRIVQPRILEPSADRVRAECPHYRACGGCALMHANDNFVARWKASVVEQALAARGIAARVVGQHVSPPASRRRAVLSGRRTKTGALVGLHARRSDVIVEVPGCRVLRPAIVAAMPLLRRIVIAGGSRSAELGLTVTEGPAGLDVAVTGGKPMTPELFSMLARLAEEGDLARLAWEGDAVLRRPPFRQFGQARVVPPPGSFLQATADAEAAMVRAVQGIVGDSARIADLYSGCGTFTLPLAEKAEIHAVEGLAPMLTALDKGWRAAKGLHRVTTETRDLARRPLLPDELAAYDAIVIDPPRAGANAQAAEIARAKIPAIAWVSCDPVTFAADAARLVAAGYALNELTVLDQFRWSPHIETVAAFNPL